MTTSDQKIEEILRKITAIERMLKHRTEPHPRSVGHGHMETGKTKDDKQAKKGVGGGLATIIAEGFLDTPQSVDEIMLRLRQDGHFYEFSVVATKLLRMVRGRELTRIRDGKKWKYVTRK